MTKKTYDIIVIGAGSGGLTVAIGAAGIGAKVLLIEKSKVGGDCTHHGCVPSKALINLGKEAKILKKYNQKIPKNLLIDEVLKKVNMVVNGIYQHETPDALKKFGIETIIGSAKFIGKNTIEVNKKKFTSKRIVIATGSRARIPQIKGIDDVNYLTNKNIFDIKKINSLIILGGGPIGCELAQAFNNLGVKVQIIQTSSTILNREDVDASKLVQDTFNQENITLRLNKEPYLLKKVEKEIVVYIKDKSSGKHSSIRSDNLLVATGRVPNIEDLDLGVAGIEFNNRGIKINSKGRTTNKYVYGVGDVVGGFQFTHLANAQAKAVLSSIIFRFPAEFETQVIPRVTFTTPEIASIGISEEDAKKENLFILKKPYSQVDRALTDLNTKGFYKIIVDKNGEIKGATLLGNGAGELIGEIALAMKNNIKINQLANTIHPYPTYGYGLRNCADQFRAMSYTPNKKKWVKKIFNLKG